jgi:hypothetical protein
MPYGVVINQLAINLSIAYSPLAMYLSTVGFHLVLVLAGFAATIGAIGMLVPLSAPSLLRAGRKAQGY